MFPHPLGSILSWSVNVYIPFPIMLKHSKLILSDNQPTYLNAYYNQTLQTTPTNIKTYLCLCNFCLAEKLYQSKLTCQMQKYFIACRLNCPVGLTIETNKNICGYLLKCCTQFLVLLTLFGHHRRNLTLRHSTNIQHLPCTNISLKQRPKKERRSLIKQVKVKHLGCS